MARGRAPSRKDPPSPPAPADTVRAAAAALMAARAIARATALRAALTSARATETATARMRRTCPCPCPPRLGVAPPGRGPPPSPAAPQAAGACVGGRPRRIARSGRASTRAAALRPCLPPSAPPWAPSPRLPWALALASGRNAPCVVAAAAVAAAAVRARAAPRSAPAPLSAPATPAGSRASGRGGGAGGGSGAAEERGDGGLAWGVGRARAVAILTCIACSIGERSCAEPCAFADVLVPVLCGWGALCFGLVGALSSSGSYHFVETRPSDGRGAAGVGSDSERRAKGGRERGARAEARGGGAGRQTDRTSPSASAARLTCDVAVLGLW